MTATTIGLLLGGALLATGMLWAAVLLVRGGAREYDHDDDRPGHIRPRPGGEGE